MIDIVDAFIAGVARAGAPITTPVFKLGGLPVFVGSLQQPICRRCGKEMNFLAQIPLNTPLRFSDKYQMAYVFMCPGSYDSRGWLECETWAPFSGANAVLLQHDQGLPRIETTTPRYPDYSANLTHVKEPAIDRSDCTLDENLLERVSEKTKIGGVPAWLQNNETPICRTCGKPMRFVAQIDAALDGSLPADPSQWSNYIFFDFGAAGLGYIFICQADCNENGAFLWQST